MFHSVLIVDTSHGGVVDLAPETGLQLSQFSLDLGVLLLRLVGRLLDVLRLNGHFAKDSPGVFEFLVEPHRLLMRSYDLINW